MAAHFPGFARLFAGAAFVTLARSQPQKHPEPRIFGTAELTDRNSRQGYPRDIPISDAIADFNTRAHADPVGASQPPLTSDEVVAAIRAWSDPPRMPASAKAVFQAIAQKAIMPRASYIRLIPGLIALHGFDIDVWWIDVQVELDKYPTDLKDVPQYAYRIRTAFLRSRPTRN